MMASMNDAANTELELLDNIVWHSLCGPQAAMATGSQSIRRYARGFSPLIGAKDAEAPDLAELAPYCDAGEQFYYSGWSGQAPRGWRVDVDARMEQYVWDGDAPSPAGEVEAIRLGPAPAAQAMALVELTHPGPFGERTPELGEYYGVVDDGRLIAMTGERMHAGGLREISGVCTHPDFQGRGLARRLMEKLIALQLARGQTPFLHVMSANAGARRLYEKMGFRHHRQRIVRIVTYVGG